MNNLLNPLLLVTFFPLLGFVIILFFKSGQSKAIRWTALITALINFGLSMWVLAQFKTGEAGLQMEVVAPWLRFPRLSIDFHLGVDGLSLLMVLLTTFLAPLAILSSWKAVEERVRGFMLLILLLETSLVGVFLSLDLVLFYIFWEFTLVPMIFLIGIWGSERRVYAAVKFFLFTMAGSLLLLLAIFYIGLQAGTFDWSELVANRSLFAGAQLWLFLAFAIAFAIKVPIFPFHTWLPDAHVEAPTAGSVMLAGVLLKMGAYGFLRFNLPLFPQVAVQAAPYMAVLAIIGILYGAAVAFAQKDLKKLVAYSSVSHLGFVMLGIFAFTLQGVSGAVLQMFNHGLSTGALFLIVGMLYERRHTRLLANFGGLWKVLPVLGGITLVFMLSSVGLPGLNGFVGEFSILLGSFTSPVYATPWFAGIATLGVILAALYLFQMFESVFLGQVTHTENQTLQDLSWREIIIVVPILILVFWIGLYPKPFFDLINPTLQSLVAMAAY
jgi:NADH-quinone oxidoreductase subunit M